MKTYKLLILLILLTVCGCSIDNGVFIIPKTKSALPQKYSYVNGKCITNNVKVEYKKLKRNSLINIINEDDDYFYFNDNNVVLAVDKKYVRINGELKINEYVAYTSKNSVLYSDCEFSEELSTFGINDEVLVIDNFANIYYVQTKDNVFGYMKQGSISRNKYSTRKIEIETNPDTNKSSQNKESHSSSGGQDPTPPPQQPTSGDGEDIQLSYHEEARISLLLNSNEKTGYVLADGTRAYITFLNRNDVVYVEQVGEQYYSILINGYRCIVDKKYVRLDSEDGYACWEGFTYNSFAYEEVDCINSIRKFETNDKVKIIDEIDNIYIVELSDSEIGYIKKNSVSVEKIVRKVEEHIETNSNNDSQNNNQSGQGGHSSSQTQPTPVPEQTDDAEWTVPVL